MNVFSLCTSNPHVYRRVKTVLCSFYVESQGIPVSMCSNELFYSSCLISADSVILYYNVPSLFVCARSCQGWAYLLCLSPSLFLFNHCGMPVWKLRCWLLGIKWPDVFTPVSPQAGPSHWCVLFSWCNSPPRCQSVNPFTWSRMSYLSDRN